MAAQEQLITTPSGEQSLVVNINAGPEPAPNPAPGPLHLIAPGTEGGGEGDVPAVEGGIDESYLSKLEAREDARLRHEGQAMGYVDPDPDPMAQAAEALRQPIPQRQTPQRQIPEKPAVESIGAPESATQPGASETQDQRGPTAATASESRTWADDLGQYLQLENTTGPLDQVWKSIVRGGVGTFRGFAGGTQNFFQSLDDLATTVSDATGLPKGGVFGALTQASDYWVKQADKLYDLSWDKRAKGSQILSYDKFIAGLVGDIVGGAVPGMASFVADKAGLAAVKGYARDGITGAVTDQAKTLMLGHALDAAQSLPYVLRAAGMGGMFAADAYSGGETGPRLAAALGTGAGMAAMTPQAQPKEIRPVTPYEAAQVDSLLRGKNNLDEIKRAEAGGEITPEMSGMLRFFAHLFPDRDAATSLKVVNELMRASDAAMAAAGMPGQPGRIVGGVRISRQADALKAALEFYQGADVGTTVHENAHLFFDKMPAAAKEPLKEWYRQEMAGKANPPIFDEFVAEKFTDWFLKNKLWLHPASRADGFGGYFGQAANRLRTFLDKVMGVDGAMPPRDVLDLFRQAATGESGDVFSNGGAAGRLPSLSNQAVYHGSPYRPATSPNPYFKADPKARVVSVDALIARESADPERVARSLAYMEAAKNGTGEKRKPIDVIDRGDGTLKVLDGNTTLESLKQLGEKDAVVRIRKTLKQRGVESWTDLYAQANEAQPMLEKMSKEWAAELGGEVQMRPGLKKQERAQRKVDAGDSTIDSLKDITASTIVFDSEDQVRAALGKIKAEHPEVMRIKDRYARPGADGYADVLLNVRLPNGHIAELQLNTKAMLAAKAGLGHDIYEIKDALHNGKTEKNAIAIEEMQGLLNGLSREVYTAARRSASSSAYSSENSKASSRDIGVPDISTLVKLGNVLGNNSSILSPIIRKSLSDFLSKAKALSSHSKYSSDMDTPPESKQNIGDFDHEGKTSFKVEPLSPAAQWENLRSWEKVGDESRPWEIVDKAAGAASVITNDKNIFGQTAHKAVNINLDRLKTGDDIKRVIAQVGEALRPEMNEARRYTRSDALVKGDALRLLADDMGMTEATLLQRRRGEAFNAEQAVAARMILVSSADDVMRMAKDIKAGNNSDASLLAFRQRVEAHAAIQAQVSGMAAEAGRALRSFRILAGESDMAPGVKLRPDDISKIVEATGGRGDIQRLADTLTTLAATGENSVTQVGKAIADARQRTFKDWFFGYRYAAMLSGIPTHVRNSLGNALVATMAIPERFVASQLGITSKWLGSSNPEHVQTQEAGALLFGYLHSQVDALKLAGGAFRTGQSRFGPQKTEELGLRTSTAPVEKIGDFLWDAMSIPSRFLGAEDEYFKGINYRAELGAQAYRQASMEGLNGDAMTARVRELMISPSEEMQRRAMDAAKIQTFNQDLTGPIRDISRGISSSFIGRVFVPFLRTPYNIFKYTMARTPLAPIFADFRADWQSGGARMEMALSKMIVGSSLMSLATALVANGTITGGGPSSKGERGVWLQNFQPYSLKFGDTWYSYGNLAEPISTYFALAADYYDAMTDWKREWDQGKVTPWELSTALVKAFAKNLTDKTFLKGVADLAHALDDPDRYAASWVQSLAGSFVPSYLGNWANSMDPELKLVGGYLDAMLNRIPELKSDLPPRRDIFGDSIAINTLGPAWMSPIRTKDDGDVSDVEREMLRLGMFIGMPSKDQTIRGVNMELTPEEYSRLLDIAGHETQLGNLKDNLNTLVSKPSYQRLAAKSDGPDGAAAAEIKGVLRDAREMALERLYRETPRIQNAVYENTPR